MALLTDHMLTALALCPKTPTNSPQDLYISDNHNYVRREEVWICWVAGLLIIWAEEFLICNDSWN